MRRKDLKYYAKTALLRWKSYLFSQAKRNPEYKKVIQKQQQLFKEKWQEVELHITPFDSYFHTYYYLPDSSIFEAPYDLEDGVPIRLHGSQLRNPLFPMYFGLVEWNNSSGKVSLGPILSHMESMGVETPIGFHWNYEEDYMLFGLQAPWKSGLTQSLGTCVYLRAFTQSQDSRFLERAKQAFAWNLISVENAGLLSATKNGLEWVEEYPESPANHVLNGHIFAIIAAIELFQLTEEKIYEFTARNWINSLLHHLPEYQYKSYLLHNVKQAKLSNVEYQGLYVGLFKHLQRLTRHPLFHELFLFYNEEISWSDFNRYYGLDS